MPSESTVTVKPASGPGIAPTRTRMPAVPNSTAVTRPVCETVATLLLLEFHVAVEVTSFLDPFDIVASADN